MQLWGSSNILQNTQKILESKKRGPYLYPSDIFEKNMQSHFFFFKGDYQTLRERHIHNFCSQWFLKLFVNNFFHNLFLNFSSQLRHNYHQHTLVTISLYCQVVSYYDVPKYKNKDTTQLLFPTFYSKILITIFFTIFVHEFCSQVLFTIFAR